MGVGTSAGPGAYSDGGEDPCSCWQPEWGLSTGLPPSSRKTELLAPFRANDELRQVGAEAEATVFTIYFGKWPSVTAGAGVSGQLPSGEKGGHPGGRLPPPLTLPGQRERECHWPEFSNIGV